jgi:hypothetical protein
MRMRRQGKLYAAAASESGTSAWRNCRALAAQVKLLP